MNKKLLLFLYLGVIILLFRLDLYAKVKVYPIPWVPEAGKQRTGNLNDGIMFENIPLDGEIYIYTVTGILVKKIELTNNPTPGKKRWMGKNENDEDVASGVYLWLIKSKEGNYRGKLIVIR